MTVHGWVKRDFQGDVNEKYCIVTCYCQPLKKVLIGFWGSKWLIKPVFRMNASKNVNDSIPDMTKCFLNEISGTVAVITSDGRMIVVRLIFFFNILFSPIKTFHRGNKEAPLGYSHIFTQPNYIV